MFEKEIKNKENHYYKEMETAIRNKNTNQECTEEFLISKLEPIIKKSCKHYFGTYDEDLLQMGRLRVLELIRNFDTNRKDIIFLGYIKKMLSFYFWDLKKKELSKKEISFVNINEVTENKLYYEEKEFSNILLKESINNLSEDEKKIVKRHIFDTISLKQLAKEMNKTHEQVKYIKKKTIEKLKKSL